MKTECVAATPDGAGVVARQIGWDIWVTLQRDGTCRAYRAENVWQVQADARVTVANRRSAISL